MRRAHHTYINDGRFDAEVLAIQDQHEELLGRMLEDFGSLSKMEQLYPVKRGVDDEGRKHPLDTKEFSSLK